MPHRLTLARVRASLRQSEDRFRLLVTAVSDAIYHLSPDWQQLVLLNSGGFLAATTVPTQSWLTQYIPATDRDWVWAAVQEAIAEQGLFTLEHRVIRAGGSIGWARSTAVPLYNADGQLTEWFGTAVDITARKKSEQAQASQVQLQQQHALFTAVQAAQEEERRRMAETLHNGIGQTLYATKLRLEQLALPAHDPHRQAVADLLADAIRQTRALSHELTPTLLESYGLQATLQSLCQRIQSPRLTWQCEVAHEADKLLPLPLQLAVYRLTQGLVHNVSQHAQATQALLRLAIESGNVLLRVQDNGRGFHPATVTEGLGLKSLRQRVQLLGGSLHLESAPGQGTRIAVRLPLS